MHGKDNEKGFYKLHAICNVKTTGANYHKFWFREQWATDNVDIQDNILVIKKKFKLNKEDAWK